MMIYQEIIINLPQITKKMNYQQIQKLPRYINSQVVKTRSLKPQRAAQSGDSGPNIDIVALYQRQYDQQAKGQGAQKGRRMDDDERAAYIKQTKERLGLNDRGLLGLSSKRSNHDGHLRYDMPYLEFNQYFNKINGVHVFKPHEMQWSLDQFMDRMLDTRDEANNRNEKIMDQRYDQYNKFVSRVNEMSDQAEADKKTQTIKDTFSNLASSDKESEETTNSTKIF